MAAGGGKAIQILADRFPRSRFTGLDISDQAIETAKRLPSKHQNVRFVRGDATDKIEGSYDVVLAFDTIHDLPQPEQCLRSIERALAPSGHFVMVEFDFSSEIEKNIGNPFAVLYYMFSLMHCVPVSMGQNGPGLGAVWGRERAMQMLMEAGFRDVVYAVSPRPQNCVFSCRKAAKESSEAYE